MSTQNARAIESLLGSELGQEPTTSEQQQQQQQQLLVDDATIQVAPEMNAGASLLQAYGGVGDPLRREDGSHDETGLMNTRVGGQVTERRSWSRSEDEAIARMVCGGFVLLPVISTLNESCHVLRTMTNNTYQVPGTMTIDFDILIPAPRRSDLLL